MSHDRREFLKAGLAGLAGATILSSCAHPKTAAQAQATPAGTSPQGDILRRELGRTGLRLPVISMGAMGAQTPGLIKAALDAGMVHIDTAHAYQGGRNEELVREAIAGRPRDSVVIGTKVVAEGEDNRTGLFTAATKAEPFLEKAELSLKRLGTDHVDIFYLHNIVRREAALFEPLLEAMTKLKKEGKTRFLGVSTHRNEPEVIRAAVESQLYDVVLTAYNFRQPHREEMRAAMAEAAAAGLGIVVMKTQAGVYYDRERTKPINMKAALKWALQDQNVHTAIPGITDFEQLEMDAQIMRDVTLTDQEKADLEQQPTVGGLYCRQCATCVPQCPHGVDIPTLMRGYMYAYGYRDLRAARAAVDSVGTLPCGSCRTCSVVNCAMGFNVSARVRDIARIGQVPSEFLTWS